MRAALHPRADAAARPAAALAVVLALLLAPAPLLPPHRLAEAVQALLGIGWLKAYLAAALVVHGAFYGGVGLLATFAVRRATSARAIVLETAVLAVAVIAAVLAIRALRLGHIPLWTNAVVPLSACVVGIAVGLGVRYRGARATAVAGVTVAAITCAVWLAGTSSDLSRHTEARLEHLVAVAPHLPGGDARFGALVRAAFAATDDPAAAGASPVEHNRAALAALGIAIGHERLARAVGLSRDSSVVKRAAALRPGTTIRGREDWARHYLLSAALAVVEHPRVSEAAGLLKEQLDAAGDGSGFSFADLAADRAGVRFAAAATRSDAAARELQARLQQTFEVSAFFPAVEDLPENLTVAEFRRGFGGVGSQRYRQLMAEIEKRIDACTGLAAGDAR